MEGSLPGDPLPETGTRGEMFGWWRKNVIDRVHAAAHSGNFAIKVAFSVLYCM